jgi:hypothetical protein
MVEHSHKAVFTRIYHNLARSRLALPNRTAVYTQRRSLRVGRNVHDKRLVLGTVKARTHNTRSTAARLAEEFRSLRLDNVDESVYTGPKTVETRDKLAARSLVQFCTDGNVRAHLADSRLRHVVGGNVLTRLGKATAFTVLDGLARREHHHDVLAGHDGKVEFGREFLHRLLAEHVGEVLAFRNRKSVLAVADGLENRDKLRKGRPRQEQRQHENFKHMFHTIL